MTLLRIDNVTKRYSTGRREYVALRGVSLELDAGELVSVWGLRRSGRTTLLRTAAGIELPDSGSVHFRGRQLSAGGDGILGVEIGYANAQFMPTQGRTVVDHVAVGLLAHGVPVERARSRAYEALSRVDAASCADVEPRLLDSAEMMRASIARVMTLEPELLLLDEPINGVDLLQRDQILGLIRSLADDGTAVLMTTGDVVTIADRMLAIDGGELRGDVTPEVADVVPLRLARAHPSG